MFLGGSYEIWGFYNNVYVDLSLVSFWNRKPTVKGATHN